MLARRDLSVAEAREKLGRAGADAAAVEDVVARAAAAGYLDDAKLAEHVVERELTRVPPPAAEWLEAKLEARGFALEVARAAVRARADRDTVAALVAAYVRRERARTGARRIYGRLVRLGHAPETVEALLGTAGADDGDL